MDSLLLYVQIVFVIHTHSAHIYQVLISDHVLSTVLCVGYTAVKERDITPSSKAHILVQNTYQEKQLGLKVDITS